MSSNKIYSPIIVAFPGIVTDVLNTSHKSFLAHKPPGIISMHIRNMNNFPTSMSSELKYKIYIVEFWLILYSFLYIKLVTF